MSDQDPIVRECFEYVPTLKVVICIPCRKCLIPGEASFTTHLRQQHRMKGLRLKYSINYLNSLTLCNPDAIDVDDTGTIEQVPHIAIKNGFLCSQCGYITICQDNRGKHSRQHLNFSTPEARRQLWLEVKVQSLFVKAGVGRYLCVREPPNAEAPQPDNAIEHRKFFADAEQTLRRMAASQAAAVYNADTHYTDTIPWVDEFGFDDVLKGLDKKQLRLVIAVSVTEEEEELLTQLLATVRDLLRESLTWFEHGYGKFVGGPILKIMNQFGPQMDLEPFRIRKKDNTLKAYFDTMCSFVCMLVRVHKSSSLLGDITCHWGYSRELVELVIQNPEDAFHVQNLLITLLQEKLHETPFVSPFCVFSAILGLDKNGRWHKATDLSSHYSALIYCGQLILMRHCTDVESRMLEVMDDSSDLPAIVKENFGEYMNQERPYPFGRILDWRLELFGYRAFEPNPNIVIWDSTQTRMIYEGLSLEMNDITKAIKILIARVHKILYEDLMLPLPNMKNVYGKSLECDQLVDFHHADPIGYNFVLDPGNSEILAQSRFVLLRRMERNPGVNAVSYSQGHGVWRPSWVDRYEEKVQEFLENLLVLVHFSAGAPLRTPELMSATWKTTANHKRSFRLFQDTMLMHVQYHKCQAVSRKPLHNIRFLPKDVGNVLMNFIVFVQPFRELIHQATSSDPEFSLPARLWCSFKGDDYSEGRFRRKVDEVFKTIGVHRMNIAKWRQISAAIIKVHFSEKEAAYFAEEGDGDAENDIARGLIALSNHSARTANQKYANSSRDMYDGIFNSGRLACHAWQKLFKLQSFEGEIQSISRETAKRIRRQIRYSEEDLLEHFRSRSGSMSVFWKSSEQMIAVHSIVRGDPEVVVILPTGGGKSLCFMLPATLPQAGITILILPLVVLRHDIRRRAQDMDINMVEWISNQENVQVTTGIVLVAVEQTQSDSFLSFILQIQSNGLLDRIVIDEAHMMFSAADYRPKMLQLMYLRRIETQFVYLSATLSNMLVKELKRAHNLWQLNVIRASCDRPNIQYDVQEPKTVDSRINFKDYVLRVIDSRMREHMKDEDRFMLFVNSHAEAEEYAKDLGCGFVHARSDAELTREQTLWEWSAHARPSKIIVGTSALGTGFHYAHVRIVFHLEKPHSIIDFAQESGRAGRDDRRARSIIFLKEVPSYSPTSELEKKDHDEQIFDMYLRKQKCLRACLSEVFDRIPLVKCEEPSSKCTICRTSNAASQSLHASSLPMRSITGSELMTTRSLVAGRELRDYKQAMNALVDRCVFCITAGRACIHRGYDCPHSSEWKSWGAPKEATRLWNVPGFHGCYTCKNPQPGVCPHLRNPKACTMRGYVLQAIFCFWQTKQSVLLEELELACLDADVSSPENFFLWLFLPTEALESQAINAVKVMQIWFKIHRTSLWDIVGREL